MVSLRISVALLGVMLLLPMASHAFCLLPSADSRLQAYCMSNLLNFKATNLRSALVLDYRLKQEGYDRGLGLKGMTQQVTFSPYVSPVLEYSSDINGGNPDKPLVLGSLTFYGDEEFFRKKGLLAGVAFGGTGRAIYGDGRYLDYNIGGSYTYSPKHDMSVMQGFANVCSKNDIGGNFYVDGCLSTNRLRRDLSAQTTSSATLSVAKLIAEGDRRVHQARFGIRRFFDDGYEQNQLTLQLDTLHNSNLFTSINVSLGDELKNTLAMSHSFTASVGTYLMKKPFNASFSYVASDGGMLLGFQREETTTLFGLKYAIHPRFSLLVGYKYTSSNIDYFDESEAIVGIQFAPIQF